LNFVIQKEPRKNVEDIEEELGMIDVSKYRYDIFCLHNDVVVGGGQDEWGCVLIYVVKEFRNLGIGEELVKMYREIYPYKPSGGFTESGYTQILKYYNWMVKRALSSGVYSKMVREGKIKMDRVKEILASVDKKIKFSDEKKSILIDKYKLNNEPLYIISENNVVIFDSALKDIIRDYHKNNVLDELIEKGIYAYAHLVEYLDVIQLYNCYGEEKYVSEAIEILVNLNPEGIGDFYFKNFNSETKNMLRKIWDDKDKYKIEIMDYYQPVNIIKPKKSIIPKIAFLKTIADRWFKINDKYEELYYSITELADGLIE
jgi:GNAT superfamily N-acetyltransferase